MADVADGGDGGDPDVDVAAIGEPAQASINAAIPDNILQPPFIVTEVGLPGRR